MNHHSKDRSRIKSLDIQIRSRFSHKGLPAPALASWRPELLSRRSNYQDEETTWRGTQTTQRGTQPRFPVTSTKTDQTYYQLLLLLSRISRVRLCATKQMEAHQIPRPWDSPGKNAGVGCHFLLQCMKVKSESEVAQSCPTVSDPMDCSLPGSSIHGIFQARVLEWGAIAFSVLSAKYFQVILDNSTWSRRINQLLLTHKTINSNKMAALLSH